MATKKKPLYIRSNTVFKKETTPLVDYFKQVEQPIIEDTTPVWKGAKIPLSMWQELTAWCQVTQKKFKSEALVLFFYDQKTNNWLRWYPPQITNGMTVKTDTDNPNFAKERKEFPNLQFGTLHHHCSSSAFASGTDKSDEEDREGVHFTIGNLGSDEHTVHCRFNIAGATHEMPANHFIEMPDELASLKCFNEATKKELFDKLIKQPVDDSKYDFRPFLKNISEPKRTKHNQQVFQPSFFKDRFNRNTKHTMSTVPEASAVESPVQKIPEEDLLAAGNELEEVILEAGSTGDGSRVGSLALMNSDAEYSDLVLHLLKPQSWFREVDRKDWIGELLLTMSNYTESADLYNEFIENNELNTNSEAFINLLKFIRKL